MKCDFCGREVSPGTLECPYCHYQFKIDATMLTPDERDAFEGVTIEEDGNTSENRNPGRESSGGEGSGRGYYERKNVPPNIKVYPIGCGSGIGMTLLILGGILALFFFLLPTFIVFAAIGAVIVFVLRLFM